MAKYNLYAGLGGGFGGYQYHCTEDYDSREDAEEAARELAIEEYQSYEGMHGILSEGDIREQYCEENELTEDELTQEVKMKSLVCIKRKLKVGFPIW